MEVNEVPYDDDQQKTKEDILKNIEEMIASKNGTFTDPNIGNGKITTSPFLKTNIIIRRCQHIFVTQYI